MNSRDSRGLPVLALAACAVMAVLTAAPALARPRQGTASCCTPFSPPNSACCVGQWQGPFRLGVSCAENGLCNTCATDEIVHAALIPTGNWLSGQVTDDYLLFVVEERGATRIPSKGVFVKLY